MSVQLLLLLDLKINFAEPGFLLSFFDLVNLHVYCVNILLLIAIVSTETMPFNYKWHCPWFLLGIERLARVYA